MNPVVMLFYNTTDTQLELSKRALTSVFEQDISVNVVVVNNGSTRSTQDWLDSMCVASFPHKLLVIHHSINQPPTAVSNEVMAKLFKNDDYILGVPNDAILPRNLYRELLKWPRGIVTAHMDGKEPPNLTQDHEAKAVHEDCHMAVALVRKWAYDAIVEKFGSFLDENYFMYASDCDLKLRMAACGIHGVQTDIQCYHYGSACWRLAAPGIGEAINRQADVDRAYFHRRWGFAVGDIRYSDAINNINFRG